jgi:uncharacterized protein YqeY
MKIQIDDLIKDAMKSGDKIRLQALRFLKTAFIVEETSGIKKELTEEDQLKIVSRLIKQRKASLETYITQKRADLAYIEKSEIEVLEAFLPVQISDEELSYTLSNLCDSMNIKELSKMGQIMQIATKHMKIKADNTRISNFLKSYLK